MDRKQQDEILEQTLKEIEKQFGKGSIMKLGDQISDLSVEALPSGILQLDVILGIGGYPKGRVVEIFGPESSGKTTVALHCVAQTQKNGGKVAFIDAEHALDPNYAKEVGVDLEELIISQPDCGEQAMEIVDTLIKSNALDLIVVDSVAALVPQAELDGEMEDQQMGMQARLMSKALRKITGYLAKSKTTIIFINQLREKISTGFAPIAGAETTTGGRALKFYASVRIDVRKIETLKRNGEAYGHKVNLKTVKNKVSAPFRTCTVTMLYGEGVDEMTSFIDEAVNLNILERTGSWFNFNGERIGQGRDSVKNYFLANADEYEQLKEIVKVKLFNKEPSKENVELEQEEE